MPAILIRVSQWARRCTVAVLNGETETEELHRQGAAAMQHHGIDHADLGGRLYLIGKEDCRFAIAEGANGDGRKIDEAAVDQLVAHVERIGADVLILDPLISFHRASENATAAMGALMDRLGDMAARYDIAVHLVHHARKGGGADADAIRGSSAIVNAARSARTMERMTSEEAGSLGLVDESPRDFVSLHSAKANLAPLAERRWFRLVSVEIATGDHVGCTEPWEPADPLSGWSPARIADLQDRLRAGGPWWRSLQSKAAWAGEHVAKAAGIATTGATWRRQAEPQLAALLRAGWLVEAAETDPQSRKNRPAVKPGRTPQMDRTWTDADG